MNHSLYIFYYMRFITIIEFTSSTIIWKSLQLFFTPFYCSILHNNYVRYYFGASKQTMHKRWPVHEVDWCAARNPRETGDVLHPVGSDEAHNNIPIRDSFQQIDREVGWRSNRDRRRLRFTRTADWPTTNIT